MVTPAWGIAVAMSMVAGAQDALYVDDDASVGGDGRSWATAYRYLRDGLAHAASPSIGEVRIAQGLYRPDRDENNPEGTGDRAASFPVPPFVTLRGGFLGRSAGKGEDPDQRDPVLYETILSGDLLGDDGPPLQGMAENCYNVVSDPFGFATVRIDGCTITGGNANGGGIQNSAAAVLSPSSLVLLNCRVVGNRATDFGAVLAGDGSLEAYDCTFDQNSSGWGGAIHGSGATDLILERCLFMQNHADNSGGALRFPMPFDAHFVTDCTFIGNDAGLDGGAAAGWITTWTRCTFISNQAVGRGGAIFQTTGAGLGGFGSAAIHACEFIDNFSFASGGAVHIGPVVTPHMPITDSLFNQNEVFTLGLGGSDLHVNVGGPGSGDVRIVNCTFGQPPASHESILVQSGPVTVTNSVFAGNAVSSISPVVGPGAAAVNFSNIPFGWPGPGGNNLADPPQFVSTVGPDGVPWSGDEDLRLAAGAPVIDQGDSGAVDPCAADLDGNVRAVDDAVTPDGGAGPAPIVDMGAYEFGAPPLADKNGNGADDACECLGDCAVPADGARGVDDLLALLAGWGGTGPCDLDGTGVSITDLLYLLAQWGPCR